jgi:predicted permease
LQLEEESMEALFRDARLALRAWRRRPAFNAIIVLILALGIGANAVVFSVIESVLLRPLPYADADELVVVRTALAATGDVAAKSSGPEFIDLRGESRVFDSVGAIWARPAALTDDRSEPEEIEMGFVTFGFLSLLGVEPLVGRDVLPEEDVLNGPRVVVLSHRLWERRYGADRAIVGKTIEMDGDPFTVVGVMPAEFSLYLPPDAGVPRSLEAWVPWGGGYEDMSRSFRVFSVVGRLGDGVSPEEASTRIASLAGRLVAEHPEAYSRSRLEFHLERLHESVTEHVRPSLLVLWATVGFVLLIACSNVANLLLVRATGLESEALLRSALGASRSRLVRQILTETSLFALLGGAGGAILAQWGVALLPWLAPGEIPRMDQVAIEGQVMAFLVGASLLSAGAVGVIAAMHVSRPGASHGLRARWSEEAGRNRLRRILIASEVGLSLVLLVGGGLLFRSFRALSTVALGYQTENVATLKLSLIDSAYPYSEPAKIGRFYRELTRGIEEIPGVEAVGAATELPLDGVAGRSGSYSFETDRGPVEWDTVTANYRTVTPGWIEALKVPLAEGRLLEWTDDLDHPDVVVIDELLARKAWPGESAIGKRLEVVVFRNERFQRTWSEVVGVVAHVRQQPGESGEEQIFLPHQQSPQRTMAFTVRGTRDITELAGAIRDQVRALEPTQPIHSIRPMDDYRADSLATYRFTMRTLGAFALVALVLASFGIYGVIAFSVSRRTREIGLRLALGAPPGRILRDVIGEGLRLAGPGLVLGVVAALALTRFLAGLLFGVTARDPMTFVAVVAFLLLVAASACYFPGRRASRLSPLQALRDE